MYPMPTVEPTYRMILMVVKTLLEQKVSPEAILATVKTMEDTISETEETRRGFETALQAVEPFIRRCDELGIEHQP